MTRQKLSVCGGYTQTCWIDGTLPGLNEMISSSRTNQYAAARQKRRAQQRVLAAIKPSLLCPVQAPVQITLKFHEPNRRRDPDNIYAGGAKIILDALVQAGILPSDGQMVLPPPEPIRYLYKIDKENPGVLVIISAENA